VGGWLVGTEMGVVSPVSLLSSSVAVLLGGMSMRRNHEERWARRGVISDYHRLFCLNRST